MARLGEMHQSHRGGLHHGSHPEGYEAAALTGHGARLGAHAATVARQEFPRQGARVLVLVVPRTASSAESNEAAHHDDQRSPEGPLLAEVRGQPSDDGRQAKGEREGEP